MAAPDLRRPALLTGTGGGGTGGGGLEPRSLTALLRTTVRTAPAPPEDDTRVQVRGRRRSVTLSQTFCSRPQRQRTVDVDEARFGKIRSAGDAVPSALLCRSRLRTAADASSISSTPLTLPPSLVPFSRPLSLAQLAARRIVRLIEAEGGATLERLELSFVVSARPPASQRMASSLARMHSARPQARSSLQEERQERDDSLINFCTKRPHSLAWRPRKQRRRLPQIQDSSRWGTGGDIDGGGGGVVLVRSPMAAFEAGGGGGGGGGGDGGADGDGGGREGITAAWRRKLGVGQTAAQAGLRRRCQGESALYVGRRTSMGARAGASVLVRTGHGVALYPID